MNLRTKNLFRLKIFIKCSIIKTVNKKFRQNKLSQLLKPLKSIHQLLIRNQNKVKLIKIKCKYNYNNIKFKLIKNEQSLISKSFNLIEF